MRTSRCGLALLVVCGVLGVLSILAMCFLTLAQLERKATQRRMHQTRAFLLARSGLEDALARLDAGQDPSGLRSRYLGEDWDASGTLNGLEGPAEVFKRGTLNQGDCPVSQALRPSWALMDNLGKPVLVPMDGRDRGYSGRLSALTDATLTYSLKVEDESGKINVNGGFLDGENRDADAIPDYRDTNVRLTTAVSDNGLGWNFQLCRILGVLGQEPELGMPVTFGTDVLDRRPLGGYRSIAQLQSLIGTTTDLSPYLTTSSWIDRKVVQPNGCLLAGQRAMNEIKKLRAPLALEPAGRPPVNLNTAPRAVLRALMRGVMGYDCYNPLVPVVIELTFAPFGVPRHEAVNAFVDQMLARRSSRPFQDWADFSAFCDTLPPLVVPLPGLSPAYLASRFYLPDLIKANFDPNTSLNKDLPDQIKFRFLDKSDLKVWSTEGCFESTGLFQVIGLGRVRGAGGKLLAEHSLAVTVRLYDLFRQTTQKDFLAGRRLEECHSLSSGSLRTTGEGASWKTWGGPGLSTLSYPNPPTVASVDAADFDGYLGLATVEAAPPSPLVGGGTLRFLHHLDDGWTADSAVAPARVTPGPSDSQLTAPLTESVWPASSGVEPNTLRPDGLHIQRDRGPAFLATNMPPSPTVGVNVYNHGAVSLWVKSVLNGGNCYNFSSVKGPPGMIAGGPNTQVFLIGRTSASWGVLLENGMKTDTGAELESSLSSADIPMRHPSLRWGLETAHFDTDEGVAGRDLTFNLRTFDRSVTKSPTRYGFLSTTASSDLFAWDTAPGTDALIVLGCPGTTRILNGPTSYAVVDEVCICDFEDAGATAVARMGTWAADRFNDGRYYKENDATFLSAPLSPAEGPSRLLWARWTAYLPNEIRKEIESSGAAAVDRLQDVRLASSSVGIELLDRNGTFSSAPLQELTQGGGIGRVLDGFRYRATFRPNLPDLSDPVLESPFLDDITFAWQPQGGPKILAWNDL